MLSFLLFCLILWACLKLGIGLFKVLGIIILIGLVFAFISYLVLPLLAILGLFFVLRLVFSY